MIVETSERKMRTALALFVTLSLSCTSAAPKSTATPAGSPAAEAAPPAGAPPAVIVTSDPNAVTGCRSIGRLDQAYDIREQDQWRKLQEEAARLGGNAALVAGEDHRAEIFACPK
jgi:hypothetical protein